MLLNKVRHMGVGGPQCNILRTIATTVYMVYTEVLTIQLRRQKNVYIFRETYCKNSYNDEYPLHLQRLGRPTTRRPTTE
jgi:hypothetical protein